MEVSKIICYTRVDGKSKTVSLKDLNLNDDCYLEDIFYAVKDAVDEHDLLYRFRRLICDEVELDTESKHYIRFTITDIHGNVCYLKLKPVRKEQ